jgi:hypothetical protein
MREIPRAGSTIPHEIVGVAPAGFTGVDLQRIDVWVPLRAPVGRMDPATWENSRGWYWLNAIARLAPGETRIFDASTIVGPYWLGSVRLRPTQPLAVES